MNYIQQTETPAGAGPQLVTLALAGHIYGHALPLALVVVGGGVGEAHFPTLLRHVLVALSPVGTHRVPKQLSAEFDRSFVDFIVERSRNYDGL